MWLSLPRVCLQQLLESSIGRRIVNQWGFFFWGSWLHWLMGRTELMQTSGKFISLFGLVSGIMNSFFSAWGIRDGGCLRMYSVVPSLWFSFSTFERSKSNLYGIYGVCLIKSSRFFSYIVIINHINCYCLISLFKNLNSLSPRDVPFFFFFWINKMCV